MDNNKWIEVELEDKNLKLYYIAVELMLDGEFTHLYMFEVCSDKDAGKWIQKIKDDAKNRLGVSDEDIKDSWYEIVENIGNRYKVGLKGLKEVSRNNIDK